MTTQAMKGVCHEMYTSGVTWSLLGSIGIYYFSLCNKKELK